MESNMSQQERQTHQRKEASSSKIIEDWPKYHWWCDYLPVLLAFFVYSPNIFIEAGEEAFIYDDPVAILKNTCVMGRKHGDFVPPSCLLYVDYWGTPMHDNNSHKSYRPLTSATFRIDNFLWSTNVSRLWHLGNVLYHAVCSFLVVKVAKKCFREATGVEKRHLDVGTVLAGCLFAVHPVHNDSISNLAGRAEPLAALFSMLAFLIYTAQNPLTLRRLALAVALAVCATLSKEIGLTVLGTMAVFLVCSEIERMKKEGFQKKIFGAKFCDMGLTVLTLLSSAKKVIKLHFVIITISTALLVYLRLLIQVKQPVFQEVSNRAAFVEDRMTRYMSYAYYATRHFGLLLMPFKLCPDWSVTTIPLVTSLKNEQAVWIAMLFLGTAIFVYHVIRQICDVECNATPVVMSLAWMVLPFIPASNIFFIVGFTLAERVLYSPSIGLCLLVGYGAAAVSKRVESVPDLKRV